MYQISPTLMNYILMIPLGLDWQIQAISGGFANPPGAGGAQKYYS